MWDPDDYESVNTFLILSEIRKLDLTLWNGFSKLSEFGNDIMLVSISNDGRVRWAPSEVFETKFSVNVKYFQFDEQTSNIIVTPWRMNSDWFSFETHEQAVQVSCTVTNKMQCGQL